MTEEDTAAGARHATGDAPGTGDAPRTDAPPGTDGSPRTDGISGPGSPPGTGDARVDEAVAGLGELASAPLEEHPVILGQIHDRLRDVLGELGPGTPATHEASATRGALATLNGPGSRGTP